MPGPSQQNDKSVMRRFVSLLMAPARTSRFETLLPKELHEPARSAYFLLDTNPEHDVENFITYTLSRLLQRLNRDTRQVHVVYQGRVRGRVMWPATLKAHYGENYDPSRYVCREVRRRYDTPENQLLKHLLERLDQSLKSIPEIVRTGTCCYSSHGELREFSENIVDRLDRMERAITSHLRHVALSEVTALSQVLDWHLLQAETARIDEYIEVARFFRRYKRAVGSKRWSTTFETGQRMLPLPGRLEASGDQWLQFALSIYRSNASKEFKTMSRKFHFNGINGSTGAPLVPPMQADELIEWIKNGDQDEDKETKDTLRITREVRDKATLGLVEDAGDPTDLTKMRWAVIYAAGVSTKVKEALAPLIAARNGIELTYTAGQTAKAFRKIFEQTPGKTDPKQLPYYLMLVGSPEEIPFKFQYGLDADHAVGRLYFDDEDHYGKYVKRLLEYEASKTSKRKKLISAFSPANTNDDATFMSSSLLAAPLSTKLHHKELEVTGNKIKYSVEQISGVAATKQALIDLLTRQDKQPAIVFTASHGVGFASGDARQRDEQGAIVCQDWPGPSVGGVNSGVDPKMLFGGKDVPQNAELSGLVVFSFGCYTAGTPRIEDFAHFKKENPQELAPQAFVSKLPQELLAGGALAFIGHVERAWDYSFVASGIGADVSTFQSTLEAIMKGKPVGHAMDHFNDRYLALARELTESEEEGLLHQYNLGEPVDPIQLVSLWTEHNDARAYVVFGDPFARLSTELMDPI